MTETRLLNIHSGILMILILFLGLSTSVFAAQGSQLPPPAPGQDQAQNDPNRPEKALVQKDQGKIEEGALASDKDISVLTRGPLHESFATVYVANPQPGMKIENQPPEPIEELPPSYKPEGRKVVWIPGYWEWDEEESDFMWISGIWRDVPPNQQWVPGYWQKFEDGYRRVSGFWTNEQLEEIVYLPEPPPAVESGPSAPAPGPNPYIYIPGTWEYTNNQYVWRTGYWSPARENWIWIPDQYVWTPRGVVFARGYWDYEIQYRGVVFAPVRFRTPIYATPGFVYTPEYAIDSDLNLLVHLFYRPDRYQYYFGDYYGNQYRDSYQPWVTSRATRNYYDPLYTYYSVAFPNRNVNMIDWIDERHTYFIQNENLRPPRTLRDQVNFYRTAQAANVGEDIIRLSTFGTSVADLSRAEDGNYRFSELSIDQLHEVRDSQRPFRSLARGRAEIESQARDGIGGLSDRLSDNPQNQRAAREGRTTTKAPGETQTGDRLNRAADNTRLRLRDYREILGEEARDLKARAGQQLDDAAKRAAGNLRQSGDALNDRLNEKRNQLNQGRDRLNEGRSQLPQGVDRTMNPSVKLQQNRNLDAMRQQFNEALGARPARPNDWPTMRQPRNFKEGLNVPTIPKFDGSLPNQNKPIPGLNRRPGRDR